MLTHKMKLLVIVSLLCVTGALADAAGTAIWRSMQVRIDTKSERAFSGRIVGGFMAAITSFPYQLSLRRFDHHACGASVIDSKWAVTAAHCMLPSISTEFLTVKGGSANRTDGEGVIFPVSEVIIHPTFNPNTYHNDIALLRIEGTFDGIANLAPIALQTSPISVGPFNIVYCVVTGWGLTNIYSDELPEILRAVRIPLVPYTECRRKWSPTLVTPSMTCAGEPRRDSCNGDSGGPLVCNNQLFGLVSWGASQCGNSYPGVYTSIPSKEVLSFIGQYVDVERR
uniref:Peptidase S1 domain-containing protein n=1 Tax=Anopheles farauti TaxID=69004 RepID=A0A182QSI1_9DIPT